MRATHDLLDSLRRAAYMDLAPWRPFGDERPLVERS